MTNSVTFPTALGGDGKTYTDDANPDTGLDGLGYIDRLVPLFKNGVAVAGYTARYAARIDAAAANADRADSAKGYVESVAGTIKHHVRDYVSGLPGICFDFERGIYSVDDGERLTSNDIGAYLNVSRATPQFNRLPNGQIIETPADKIGRSTQQNPRRMAYMFRGDTPENLLLDSDNLTTSSWIKSFTTTVTTINDAFPLFKDKGSAFLLNDVQTPGVNQRITYTVMSGDTFTAGAYIKAHTQADIGKQVRLNIRRIGEGPLEQTGTVHALTRDYQLVSVQHTFSSDQSGLSFDIRPTVSDLAVSGIIVGAAMLVPGALLPDVYLRNGGAIATYVRDRVSVTIPTQFRSPEWSLCVVGDNVVATDPVLGNRFISIGRGTAENRIDIRAGAGSIIVNSSGESTAVSDGIPENAAFSIVFSYSNGRAGVTVNGKNVGTYNVGEMLPPSRVDVGRGQLLSIPVIRANFYYVKYLPLRLDAGTAELMTSEGV